MNSKTIPQRNPSCIRLLFPAPLFCAIKDVIEWAIFCSGVYAKSSIRLTAVKAATTDTPIVLTII